MNYLLDMKKFIIAVAVTASFAGSYAYAQDEKISSVNEEPLELRKIMQDMGDDMKVITDAISREDWALIKTTALKIADHPQPSIGEKVRILAFAGTDVSKFKAHDGKTHASASLLSEIAIREDGYAVIDEFATLQKSCLACHQQFRQAFQKHFYSAN